MPRIVSLIASATEITCALGFEDQLVGRSHECDFPPSVGRLPVCTEPKFPVEGSSREIDQRVKDILQESASVYRVHADLLQQLQPDVIITQTQCDVCAVSEKDVVAAICEWLGKQPAVVSLVPNALADVWTDIQLVADALDAAPRGREVIANLQRRMADVATRCDNAADRPRVATLEWIDPLMAGGNWMPELVAMAGGENLFGEAGKHSPTMSWEALCESDPDVIVALPCGFDLPRTRTEMHQLTSRPEWSTLKAVQNGNVFVTDGNQYFNRPGPRLAESLEILAEIFHPKKFDFGHLGTGWQRY